MQSTFEPTVAPNGFTSVRLGEFLLSESNKCVTLSDISFEAYQFYPSSPFGTGLDHIGRGAEYGSASRSRTVAEFGGSGGRGEGGLAKAHAMSVVVL